jgi:hypothetical protein
MCYQHLAIQLLLAEAIQDLHVALTKVNFQSKAADCLFRCLPGT